MAEPDQGYRRGLERFRVIAAMRPAQSLRQVFRWMCAKRIRTNQPTVASASP
jgi:hypothetical protein